MAPPAQVFECDCSHFCGGTLHTVSRSTFYNHQPYRHQLAAISSAFLAGHAAWTDRMDPSNSDIRGTEPVGQRARIHASDMEPHASDQHQDPEETQDGHAPGFENEDNLQELPRYNEEHETQHEEIEERDNTTAHAPDPGSISDQLRDEAAADGAHHTDENNEERYEEEEQADFTPLGEREPVQPLAEDFVPCVEELKIAREFRLALQHASLENGDIDTESLVRLRNPPQTLFELPDPDILLSLKLFISTTNASNQTYTDVCADIADVHPEITPLSHAAIKKEIAAMSGVVPIVHDMCPNSCLAYTGPYAELQACPMCGETRYDLLTAAVTPEKKKTSRQHFYTIPLGPQLQALWRTPEGAYNLRHRYRCTNKIIVELTKPGSDGHIKEFNDIYHGREYLEAVARDDIKTDDMVLMFSMDGAQLYQDKTSDCWIYIWVIFDLPPHMRYKKKHVLPGGFIPGPNNPKNTDSFFFPGFHHLAALQKEGLRIWDASENRLFTSYIFLYLGGADGPGSVHFTGLVGHHGSYPCRLYCDLKGRHKPGTPFYYPTLLKPNDYSVSGCDHPDVSVDAIHGGSPEEYQKNLIYLLKSRNPTNYKDRRKETGISNSSIFSGLSPRHRLPIPAGFPGDAMHSTTLNIGELLLPLWRGLFQCAPTDDIASWSWVVLTGEVWKKHGAAVARARQYMPGSYDRPPRNIAEKISSGYKAKEWQSYLYGLAPALLRDILPFDLWQNFCKLVHGVRLLLQLDILLSQIQDAHKILQSFFEEFELLYVQRRTDRIHFVRPCLHALLHMGPETVRVGPINLYSAWTMERVIGDLGSEIGQPSNPYHNLSERGLRRCQTNAMKAIFPVLDRTKTALPRGSLDLGDGYILLRAKEEYAYFIEGDEGRVIKSYIVEQEALLGNEAPVNWAGPRLSKWARLLLPTGQIARSAWKETLKAPEDLRQSRCVKLRIDGRIEFAQVQYFFNAVIGGTRQTLALISLYSRPDETLFRESFSTVWSMTELGAEGLRVVAAKTILSTFSAQPHDYRVNEGDERVFVWEDIGLPMALLSGATQDLDGE